jgi:[protein-PII] uridylyltransferase
MSLRPEDASPPEPAAGTSPAFTPLSGTQKPEKGGKTAGNMLAQISVSGLASAGLQPFLGKEEAGKEEAESSSTAPGKPAKNRISSRRRERLLIALKQRYQGERQLIRERFETKRQPGPCLKALTQLTDGMIHTLHAFWLSSLPAKERKLLTEGVALIAVGGYGRQEMYPASDIDLLFLHGPEVPETSLAGMVEFILYLLWDIGCKVGHAIRTVEESLTFATEDMTGRTNLLEMRPICGSADLAEALASGFRHRFGSETVQEFVEAKLQERDRRHERSGDSRYVLEPNLKEGKGGLRDLHTLYWICRYYYDIGKLQELEKRGILTPHEYRQVQSAATFLQTVRCALHWQAGRAEERLTFDRQRHMADFLGYRDQAGVRAVERFMKRYYLAARTVGAFTRMVCAVLEEEKKRRPRLALGQLFRGARLPDGFRLEGERLHFAEENVPDRDPVKIIALFKIAQERQLDIHPRSLQWISRRLHRIDRALQSNAKANRLFLEILLDEKHNPQSTLRKMSEAGVLGRFLPDFGRVTGQMQFDMYHVYTVDEHTILAIGILHATEKGQNADIFPLSTRIFPQIHSRRVLYLSLFAHDIAKGRGGDHSLLGERVVTRMAQRFGFTPEETETAAWLVRYHLLFSHTAFKRDLNDPRTVRDFVAKVQTLERLRLLLILTAADIHAVGPQVWNGWKGALLRDLYQRAEAVMGGRDPEEERESQAAALKQGLTVRLPNWPEDAIQTYLDISSPAYWSSFTFGHHATLLRMMREVEQNHLPLRMETHVDEFRSITEMMICTYDQHGLFYKLAGALSLSGANIVGAKVFTLKNGMAVDVFVIQDGEGKAFHRPDKLARLTVLLEQLITGRKRIEQEMELAPPPLPSRYEVFAREPQIFLDNNASATHTVIEISASDRMGLLYAITRTLSELNLTLTTAHIATYGEKVVDVFYVKDIYGMKLVGKDKEQQVVDALRAALKSGAAMAAASRNLPLKKA